MSDLFSYFDAWEPLLKARKAKGLDKWERLKNIAEKLQGKDVKAIAFTCAHPSHAGEPVKHLLGSVEGNLHFLLGYGNPQFHLAPYHWQIIDPNTTDEEAQETFSRMHHPTNPVAWAKLGVDVGDEGDTEEGQAHELAKQAKVKKVSEDQRKAESVKAKSPTGSYTCYPSEGLVENDQTGHVYRWDTVKDTFFTAQNPQLVEVMENASVQKSLEGVRFRNTPPDDVRTYARAFRGDDFEPEVWPLVKSRMPRPGNILRLETKNAETVYGVITFDSLDFFNRAAEPVEVKVFDRAYKSFSLAEDGNVPPAALLAFIVKHFKVNPSLLKEVTAGDSLVKSDGFVTYVDGEPTPGFEDVPSGYSEGLVKSIVLDGDVLRVVLERP